MRISLRGICAMLVEKAIVLTTYNDDNRYDDDRYGPHCRCRSSDTTLWPDDFSSRGRQYLAQRPHQDRTASRRRRQNGALATSVRRSSLLAVQHRTVSKATLTRKLNVGNINGAAAAQGMVLEGLIKRRKRETAMCFRSEYGDPKVRVLDPLRREYPQSVVAEWASISRRGLLSRTTPS